MKQSNIHDDGVDLALRSLVQTSPPAGMEDRILHRLQQHRLQQQRTGTARVSLLSLSRANTPLVGLYLAGAMAASAVLAIIFSWHHHAASPPPQARLGPSSLPFAAHPVAVPRFEQPMPSHLAGGPHPTAQHRTTANPTTANRAVSGLVVSGPAVSFPAPEAPLTHQEKLLLVIARSPQPELTAVLDLVRSTETITPSNHQLQASFHNDNSGGFE